MEKIHSKNLRPIVQDVPFLTYFFNSPRYGSVKSKLKKPGQSHSLQERVYTTVPKGIMATYILPLIELKFSVFQSDKWIHVSLLSDPPLPLAMTFFVISLRF